MKWLIGSLIAFVVVAVLVVGSVIGNYISLNNEFVNYETKIVALHDDVPNIITKTTNTIISKASVLKMYRDDFKEVVKGNMQGRYGSNGSNATWQWIQEHNVQMDTSMFKDIMNDIEAGNNEMQSRQTEILEIKRVYDKRRREAIPSLYNSILLHYPKIDMDKYTKLILNEQARQAEATKNLDAIILK